MMLDVLIINPAAYCGTPRRGPYELKGFLKQCESRGLRSKFIDLQERVGSNDIPFPKDHLNAVTKLLHKYRARVYLITFRTTAGPWAMATASAAKKLESNSIVVAYAPRIEQRVERMMARDECPIDHLIPASDKTDVSALVEKLLDKRTTLGAHQKHALSNIQMPIYDEGTSDSSVFTLSPPWISPDQTIAAIQVGRGCPEKCTFCAARLGRGAQPIYARAEDIVDQAEAAYSQLDLEQRLFVMLETENLTSKPSLIQEICSIRKRRNASFKWGAYGRIDHIDEEMLKLLVSAGCVFLFFGIETASGRLLKVLGKTFDTSIVLPTIKSIHASGIRTQNSFIFGIPSETYSDFVATAELLAHVAWQGGFVDWTPLRIEAGSAIERMISHHPPRLLQESELYRDMSEAGMSPEDTDVDAAYRIYGVDMDDIDTDIACIIARRWRQLLLHTPLTIYVLHQGLGISVESILEACAKPDSTDNLEFIQNFWTKQESSISNFIAQFYDSEATHNLSFNRNTKDQTFNLIYREIRKNPDLIPRIYSLNWWKGTYQEEAKFEHSATT